MGNTTKKMKALKLPLIACILAVVSSCTHKELCYDHTHTVQVRITFDWTLAPDASVSTMSVYFFPDGAGLPLRYDFTDMDGGVANVPYGTYKVFCMNSDTRTILYRNTESWDTFEIYTRKASVLEGMGMAVASADRAPVAEGAEGQDAVLAPDMIWADRATISLDEEVSSVSMTMYPDEAVCTYEYVIHDVRNLQYASALSGSLSGMSGGLYVGPDKLDSARVTVPFEAYKDGEDMVKGKFFTFGHCPDTANAGVHKFVMYVILQDGSKWYYTYDVTDQVHDAQDPKHVFIELYGLPLPEPIHDGGIVPSVDEWEDVVVDVIM